MPDAIDLERLERNLSALADWMPVADADFLITLVRAERERRAQIAATWRCRECGETIDVDERGRMLHWSPRICNWDWTITLDATLEAQHFHGDSDHPAERVTEVERG